MKCTVGNGIRVRGRGEQGQGNGSRQWLGWVGPLAFQFCGSCSLPRRLLALRAPPPRFSSATEGLMTVLRVEPQPGSCSSSWRCGRRVTKWIERLLPAPSAPAMGLWDWRRQGPGRLTVRVLSPLADVQRHCVKGVLAGWHGAFIL